MYLWEKTQRPDFTLDQKELATPLAQVSRERGRISGKMKVLGFGLRGGRSTSYLLLIE